MAGALFLLPDHDGDDNGHEEIDGVVGGVVGDDDDDVQPQSRKSKV